MLIHPSSLSKIMSNPKSGKVEDLSVGAMTYCKQLAKEFVYGFRATVSAKVLEKGIEVEPDSIKLYNDVFFTNYSKNTERRSNEWLCGECDIYTGNKVIDIKSAWSLSTFPALSEDVEDSDYEWQGRAYMMLWDAPEFELAYCMVNTPDHLIGFEDPALHIVDHIPPELRVTRCMYKRDMALEEKIKIKVDAANTYINRIIDRIADDHR